MLKTEIVSWQGTVEKVKYAAEEALRNERCAISPGDSGGARGKQGCRGGPGGTNPSTTEILPGYNQENKDAATAASSGRGAALLQVMENSTFCPYTQVKLVDLGSQLQQKPLESTISLAPLPLGYRGGWDHSAWIGDGKGGLPDSSSRPAAATAQCTSDPRESLTSQVGEGCTSHHMAKSG